MCILPHTKKHIFFKKEKMNGISKRSGSALLTAGGGGWWETGFNIGHDDICTS